MRSQPTAQKSQPQKKLLRDRYLNGVQHIPTVVDATMLVVPVVQYDHRLAHRRTVEDECPLLWGRPVDMGHAELNAIDREARAVRANQLNHRDARGVDVRCKSGGCQHKREKSAALLNISSSFLLWSKITPPCLLGKEDSS